MCFIISSIMENITKHIKPLRLEGLPEDMRRELKEARVSRGWSQAGRGAVSWLASDTHLLQSKPARSCRDSIRSSIWSVTILHRDLLMIPRDAGPCRAGDAPRSSPPRSADRDAQDERPLYAADDDDDEEDTRVRLKLDPTYSKHWRFGCTVGRSASSTVSSATAMCFHSNRNILTIRTGRH